MRFFPGRKKRRLSSRSGDKYSFSRHVAAKNSAKKSGRFAKLKAFSASLDWDKIRINGIIGLFCVIWVCLWGRAWYLQMIAGPSLADKAHRQHMAIELVSGKRGRIFDRNGQTLARSVEVRSVYANPSGVEDIDRTVAALAPILEIDREKLRKDLARSGKQFIWLKRKIDDSAAIAIKKANLPGIGLSKEYERFYPFKHMAGQLIGFVGMDDKGLEGIERSLDAELGVMPVRQLVQRDATGRRFYQREKGRGEPVGNDVTLTLDMRFQFIAEEAVARAAREFDARWSGALVVEIASGDILAWAQYPFFNPNNYRQASAAIYRNRLASDALEPGSTFKPLVMAAAINEKKVAPNTLINCEGGKWNYNKYVIRDTSTQGILPASKVIRYSSNIGMAKIGQSMGAKVFHRYLSKLGFGEVNAIPIANSRGILRKPRDWGEMDVMATSFGQSISVTALQMAQAYLTFFNHGVYKPLRLVIDENAAGKETDAKATRIFSEKSVAEVMDMMRDVVEAPDGTGKRARVEGVAVGGKTGTAQKADARSKTYGNEHLASFVGFFPAVNPAYFILVFVDEPAKNQFGGIVAAPVFSEIATRVLSQTGAFAENRPTAAKIGKRDKTPRGLKLASAPAQPWNRTSTLNAIAKAPDPLSMKLPGHLAKAPENVPNVTGKSLRNAVELFARAGIVPELKGSGSKVVRQSPSAGTPWSHFDKDQICTLWLSEG